jgi:hypothetical protein
MKILPLGIFAGRFYKKYAKLPELRKMQDNDILPY